MLRPKGSKNKPKVSVLEYHTESIIQTITMPNAPTLPKADKRKGRIVSEAQKKAMQEGRRRSKAEKMGIDLSMVTTNNPLDKMMDIRPIMMYTGKEEDYIDFLPALKASLIQYKQIKKFESISLEMVQAGFSNPKNIVEVLKKYVELKKI